MTWLLALGLAQAFGAALPPTAPPDEPLPTTVEGMKEETFAVARQLMNDYPRRTDPLGLLGTVYRQYGDTAEAVKCWERVLARNPRRADACHGLGMVALAKGEPEQAADYWRKAQEIDPRLPGVYGRYAMALMEMGKLDEAVAALERELRNSPPANEWYHLLGQAHLQLRNYDKARDNYLKALELRAEDSGTCYGLSLAYARLGQAEKSREYRERFQRIRSEEERASSARRRAEPDRVWAARVLADTLRAAGVLYAADGAWWKAERHWRRAAALDPKNVLCRQHLVDLLVQLRRTDEAIPFCEQLRTIDPKNPTYHLNTGVLLARVGRLDEAERALRASIEAAPQRAIGYYSLARLLMMAKDRLGEARDAAQKLVELEQTAGNYAVLAEAHYRAGDLASARAALAEARKLNSVDREYLRVRQLVEEGK